MIPPATPEYVQMASALCVDCRMCCDGTLFVGVIVHQGEEDALKALRPDIVFEDEGNVRIFCQPCPADSLAGCAIYATRPQECRTFDCQTLQALAAGRIDASEARRRIDEVLDQRAQFMATCGASNFNEACQMVRQDEARCRSEGRALPQSAFEMLVLLRLIDLYLRPADEAMTMGGTDGKTADG